MIAAEYNRQDVVKMLLNKGADLNARDEVGYNYTVYTHLLMH